MGNVLVPKKIKVGFQERSDTYSGLLAYVIYHDGKIWRKEDSWKRWVFSYITPEQKEEKIQKQRKDREEGLRSWYNKKTNDTYFQSVKQRYPNVEAYVDDNMKNFYPSLGSVSSNPKIVPVEYPNEPMEGFVLNKKVGGYKSDWNFRQAYCRVYDPRGFEFEITIPNLLYILEQANSIKGKGLEGKFVYGWDGKDLVLLPEESPEYKKGVSFTELQQKKVSVKQLVEGNVYVMKDMTEATFMKKAPFYNKGVKKDTVLWFWKKEPYPDFQTLPISDVKEDTGEVDEKYAFRMDELGKKATYNPKCEKEDVYELVTAQEVTDFFRTKKSSYDAFPAHLPLKTKGKYKEVSISENYRTYYLRNRRYGSMIGDSYDSVTKLLQHYKLYKKTTHDKQERQDNPSPEGGN